MTGQPIGSIDFQKTVGSTNLIDIQSAPLTENINFNGKGVRVVSIAGPEITVINGSQNGSVVVFNSGEGENSFLSGFSIINGSSDFGGGIFCYQSSPIIENCIISGNTAGGGGGISCKNNSNPFIVECIIENNAATLNDIGGGGGGDIQFLFAEDILGNNPPPYPRHSKQYRDLYKMKEAMQAERVAGFKAFIDDVQSGGFPAEEHVIKTPNQLMDGFLAAVEGDD